MGGLKKLFGGGHTPKVQKVAPAVQAVESADTSADVENSTTAKKKRVAFAALFLFVVVRRFESEARGSVPGNACDRRFPFFKKSPYSI